MDRRLPQLDILRAVAIFFVLGRHLLFIPPHAPSLFWSVVLFWKQCGWIGVDLFFVLSGFLISGLLFSAYIHHGEIKAGRFLARRALKLYPAFYAFLLISLSARLNPPSPRQILGEILFLQNYLDSAWNHTWSLAVEEHFYLLLVALFLFLAKSKTGFRRLPFIILTVCAGLTLLRTALAFGYHFPWTRILIKTHFRIDSLFFGVLLSWLTHFKKEALLAWLDPRRFWVGAACLSLILPVMMMDLKLQPFSYSLGLTCLYVGFGGLMLMWVSASRPWEKSPPVFASLLSKIGRHSYSIYLWHMPVYALAVTLVRNWLKIPSFGLELAVYVFGSIGVGAALSLLIEIPVLKLRDRLIPSRVL